MVDSEAGTGTGSKPFGAFPLAIRVAQRSILLSILIPILLRTVLRARVPWLRLAIGVASAGCAIVGLIATYYAVIRYPYMGLVDAADGDLFSQYVESRPKWMLRLAQGVGFLACAMAIIVPLSDGQITASELLLILYALSILAFLVFLTFYYNREDHPTIATFLRCSMGLGIFFYPIFLPAILLGSMRVNVLLDEVSMKLQSEKRRGRG
jgi:hypothetical protein